MPGIEWALGRPDWYVRPIGPPIRIDPGTGGGGGGAGGGSGGTGGGGGPTGGQTHFELNKLAGNMLLSFELSNWSSRGDLRVPFRLFYNSLSSSQLGSDTTLGLGWTHSYSMRLEWAPSEQYQTPKSQITFVRSDGMRFPFTPAPGQGGYLYHGSDGIPAKLTWDAFNFTLENSARFKYVFTGTTGLLNSVLDPHGNSITITRNSHGQPTEVTDPSNRKLLFGYTYVGPGAKLSSVTEPSGLSWTIGHSANNLTGITYPPLSGQVLSRSFAYQPYSSRMSSQTDLEGNTWGYSYWPQTFRLQAVNPPAGSSTWYEYAQTYTEETISGVSNVILNSRVHYQDGKVTQTSHSLGINEYFSADSKGNLAQYTDPLGRNWSWTYNTASTDRLQQNNVLTASDPMGRTTSVAYNAAGYVTSVTNPLGQSSTVTYDASNRPLAFFDHQSNKRMELAYDSYGQVTTITGADQSYLQLTRDSQGNLTGMMQASRPTGSSTTPILTLPASSATFNSWGRPINVSAVGITQTFLYDSWHRLRGIQNGDGTTSTITLSPEGNVLTAVNERNKASAFTYDPIGRLLTATDANQSTTSYAYNDTLAVYQGGGYGFSVTETGPTGNTITTTTDRAMRPAAQWLTDGRWEGWTFDAAGNLTQSKQGTYLGGSAPTVVQTQAYTYNNAGQLTGKNYFPFQTGVSVTYDSAGRQTSMTDATGTSSVAYDSLNRISSMTTPQGVLTYAYNATFDLASRTLNGTKTTTYGRDHFGRVTSMTNPVGETTSYFYNSATGRLDWQQFANNTKETFTYDSLGRLQMQDLRNTSNNALLSRVAYTYLADGLISTIDSSSQGGLTTYSYDNVGQLLAAVGPGFTGSYSYDANGNRTAKTENGQAWTYTYGASDRLLSATGPSGTTSYGYDFAGRANLISGPGGNTALAYNADGYVTGITYPNSTADAFVTNSFGQRVSQSGVSGAKTFTRAGLGVTSPLLSDGQADYTPGISERRAGVSTWQHAGSKSVGRQLTAGGSVTASRNYSPWGELKSSWGAWKGPFGYGGSVGYQSDPNGLQLLGHRYYDPAAGRFLSPDPIQDGGNWYAYAGNSPISFADPEGLARTRLYRLWNAIRGEFMKWGITKQDPPELRYSKQPIKDPVTGQKVPVYLEPVAEYDVRAEARRDEREMVMSDAGPYNREPWSPYGRNRSERVPGAFEASVSLAACEDVSLE